MYKFVTAVQIAGMIWWWRWVANHNASETVKTVIKDLIMFKTLTTVSEL